ncbi:hypothetical protein E1301_Tti003042 [Triplophysa tibetana]|uniref:Uncharacterized protein n=1 Tax=Triplophysa tibetana TaxID=1572043 RepID=A0A5A9NMB8_9TELE|nr:hypothetical protein E1301_Tti003042 [Triplophysa tibetana]
MRPKRVCIEPNCITCECDRSALIIGYSLSLNTCVGRKRRFLKWELHHHPRNGTADVRRTQRRSSGLQRREMLRMIRPLNSVAVR